MGQIDEKLYANSYCIDYIDNEFIVALGDKNDDKVTIKSLMCLPVDSFKEFIDTMSAAIYKYQKETGKDFFEFTKDDNLKVKGDDCHGKCDK